MYGYAEHNEITPDQVLQKITQQEIFEFILKQPFSFTSRYCSPFREDKKPGCRFEERPDGAIVFIDFGERLLRPYKTHRSAFGMVMDAYNVTLDKAVRILCEAFGLSTDSRDYSNNPIVFEYKGSDSNSVTSINCESKPFNKHDVWYWSQFIIKTEHLTQDKTFSVKKFSIDNSKGYRVFTPYMYCYCFDFISKKKIYQPFSTNYRWITNCDEDNIGNFDNLPETGDELIIKKSYKDHRVLRNLNLGLNVIWLQNEGCVPSMDILKNLVDRFKLITIFYDNDPDGILAAKKLCDIFNLIRKDCARVVFLPQVEAHKRLYGQYLKDPGEFVSKEGRQDLITALKQIGINGKDT